jgi:hypothetical protein
VFDPAISGENGRPSISTLTQNLPIGDYILCRDHDPASFPYDEDAEELTRINDLAVADNHSVRSNVKVRDGWVLELMSHGEPNFDNLVSGDNAYATRGPTRQSQDEMRRELGRSMTGNCRREGFKILEKSCELSKASPGN